MTAARLEPLLVSPMEKGFWRGTIRALLVLRLDGQIDAGLLVESLDRLQRRHPKLRAVIAPGRDGRPRYHFDQPMPPIPFRMMEYDEGEAPWREEARHVMHIAPPPAGHWVAVTLLRSRSQDCSHLILSVHHAIADGRSAIMLVHDLLTEYATLESHVDEAPRPESPVFSPARAPVSGSWRNRLWLARRFLRLQRQEKRIGRTPLPLGRSVPECSQWEHWVFSREETLGLIRRCRKEHVSFSGVLIAAGFCGLMDCLPVSEASFTWNTPFDVRDALGEPDAARALGSFVSAMGDFYTIPQKPLFWDLARRAHNSIQAFVQHEGPAMGYNMMDVAASPLFPALQRLMERVLPSGGLRTTLFITHYGVPEMRDSYGSLCPRECTLVFKGDQFTGPLLVMEGLVIGGRLNIGFAADGLDPAFWERLHRAVRQHLDRAAVHGAVEKTR